MSGELTFERAMEIIQPKPAVRTEAGGEWPKMLYHAKLAAQGRVFETSDEFLAEKTSGWSEKPIPA